MSTNRGTANRSFALLGILARSALDISNGELTMTYTAGILSRVT